MGDQIPSFFFHLSFTPIARLNDLSILLGKRMVILMSIWQYSSRLAIEFKLRNASLFGKMSAWVNDSILFYIHSTINLCRHHLTIYALLEKKTKTVIAWHVEVNRKRKG